MPIIVAEMSGRPTGTDIVGRKRTNFTTDLLAWRASWCTPSKDSWSDCDFDGRDGAEELNKDAPGSRRRITVSIQERKKT